jgi:hypothetical protein
VPAAPAHRSRALDGETITASSLEVQVDLAPPPQFSARYSRTPPSSSWVVHFRVESNS